MGVQPSLLGGFTPICNLCGVTLCWDISQEDYEEAREFWENWKCRDCNPDYSGARKKWIEEHSKGGEG